MLAEAMPSSAKAFEQIAPPVQPIAAGTPYEVPTAKSTLPRWVAAAVNFSVMLPSLSAAVHVSCDLCRTVSQDTPSLSKHAYNIS